MVRKNRGIYEILCTSWVLINMAPRNSVYVRRLIARLCKVQAGRIVLPPVGRGDDGAPRSSPTSAL